MPDFCFENKKVESLWRRRRRWRTNNRSWVVEALSIVDDFVLGPAHCPPRRPQNLHPFTRPVDPELVGGLEAVANGTEA